MSTAQTNAPATKYDPVAKTLHWLIAALVILMLAFGPGLEDLEGQELTDTLMGHSGLGLTVLVLVIIRLIWRRTHTPPPLPADMPRWQVISAKASHHLLYLLIFLQPIWGILQARFGDEAVRPFGLFSLNGAESEALHELFHGLHGATAFALYVLIGLHIAAALYHHFVRRDNVLKRMLPFVKV